MDDEELTMNTVQDTDPTFMYSPAASGSKIRLMNWESSRADRDIPHQTAQWLSRLKQYPSGMRRVAYSHKLLGDAVSLYGRVGPNAASYAVQVDGSTTPTFCATKSRFEPGVLLCRGNNLGPGKHTLKSFRRPGIGQVCSVDYAKVSTTESIQQRSARSQSRRILLLVVVLSAIC
ncbi:hypothetical protein E1B28_010129 [Marasmius oreades]|uniref:Uncharacterized protein n=1 Tax=Marasmius oreades TaxID=181124 RepID=A0A9P7RX67_9AGAR|nr:uncharacterized protein E1B28_010129 [Marasmius oreades]KAG7091072.1 hypothetical protein E1B28_010129 [Marasmius oreades]